MENLYPSYVGMKKLSSQQVGAILPDPETPRDTTISGMIGIVSDGADVLASSLDDLEKTLNPVLRPMEPDNIKTGIPSPSTCEFLARLREINTRLYELNNRIHELKRRTCL